YTRLNHIGGKSFCRNVVNCNNALNNRARLSGDNTSLERWVIKPNKHRLVRLDIGSQVQVNSMRILGHLKSEILSDKVDIILLFAYRGYRSLTICGSLQVVALCVIN